MDYGEKEHTVTWGETWKTIAVRYKISVVSLMQANPSAMVYIRLRPGERIRIPQFDYYVRPSMNGGARPTQRRSLSGVSTALRSWGYSQEHYAIPVSPEIAGRAAQAAEEVVPAVPAWMETAKSEIGIVEMRGASANPRILEYFEASHFWGTDDSGAENAWCASFVAWVMRENGYTPVRSAFRAREWGNFGQTIEEPVYGAIGIKSRTGGGHVAFVVGRNAAGDKLYMLGGNQKNEVQISEYPRAVWTRFVVPVDYDSQRGELPVFNSTASAAGSEE